MVVGSDLRQPRATAYVYAFERETGAVRWRADGGPGVASDLVLASPLLYAATLADEVLALDIETGRRVWRFSTGAANDAFLMTSSPAIEDGRVFFGGLDGALYALDAASGTQLWKRRLGGRISSGVLVAAGFVYAGTSERRLYRVRADSGDVATSAETGEAPPSGRLALANGCLLAFLGDRALACYTRGLDRALWIRTGAHAWSSSRPYAARGIVLAGSETGELVAFRPADGEVVWSENVGGTIRGIGTTAEGLYIGTLKGEVQARPWPDQRVMPSS